MKINTEYIYLIISFVSLLFSIYAVYYPYKDKINLICGWLYEIDEKGNIKETLLSVEAVNVGNKKNIIDEIGICIGNQHINLRNHLSQKELDSNKKYQWKIKLNDLMKKKNELNQDKIVYGYVVDTKGKRVKKAFRTEKNKKLRLNMLNNDKT